MDWVLAQSAAKTKVRQTFGEPAEEYPFPQFAYARTSNLSLIVAERMHICFSIEMSATQALRRSEENCGVGRGIMGGGVRG